DRRAGMAVGPVAPFENDEAGQRQAGQANDKNEEPKGEQHVVESPSRRGDRRPVASAGIPPPVAPPGYPRRESARSWYRGAAATRVHPRAPRCGPVQGSATVQPPLPGSSALGGRRFPSPTLSPSPRTRRGRPTRVSAPPPPQERHGTPTTSASGCGPAPGRSPCP